MNTLSSNRSPMAPFPFQLRWSLLLVVVALLAACGGDPPVPCGDGIPQQTLFVRETTLLQPCFEDPEGEKLTLSGKAADPKIATVLILGRAIRIQGLYPGNTTVTVTAEDVGGQTASMDIDVLVPNRAPILSGRIRPLRMLEMGSKTLLIDENFRDPDGQQLTFDATSADGSIASAEIVDSIKLFIRGVSLGETTVKVIAKDPGGLTAEREVEVAVMEPVLALEDDFETGIKPEWVSNFASYRKNEDGMMWLRSIYNGWFGLADWGGVNTVEWEFRTATGRDQEAVNTGFMAINNYIAGVPYAYFFLTGVATGWLGSDDDANYRLVTCCNGWNTEGRWYGESDAIPSEDDHKELVELTMTARNGTLLIKAGTTELVEVDMDARGWPGVLDIARLANYTPDGSNTSSNHVWSYYDWADVWGIVGSDGEADWHSGPPVDMSGLSSKSGPGVGVPSIEVRKK